ncbi:duf821 domain-containing protein [Colletotrichum sojae]|uniref:Duf821 domain-containing protein n=1 Tax=Colletotrichum sojae TaxID=2175907 RepID=A0A8H6JSC1_9PEZI|nr:duf821 domain-containing protein [Colletotrichum sojae]
MRQYHRIRRLWPLVVISAFGLIGYGLWCPSKPDLKNYDHGRPVESISGSGLASNKLRHFENLHLTVEECRVTFPGLTKEIDVAVAAGPFQLSIKDASVSLLGQIKDNKMRIIRAPRPVDMSDQWKEGLQVITTKQRLMIYQRQRAALHQINRALLTAPNPLPDVVFNLYIQDTPVSNSWSHSRPVLSSSRHIFPIPHFAFWAWDQSFIRSIPHAAAATQQIEAALPFDRKDPRAVWRGTAWFNNGASANPKSRQDLLQATRNAVWADVQALDWTNNGENATNALQIEDFCRYKYIIHTEGVSYSGRLQFHQLCESVLISPPFEWMQHTTHLAKPVYSSVLLGRSETHLAGQDAVSGDHGEYPSLSVQKTWPVMVRPEEANMVFVNPDWSDLEATISWLEKHPDVAHGIAQRQRALFVGRGYLSPAAETCYWRALIEGWSHVVRADDDLWEETEVLSWEEFSVRAEKNQKRF